MAQLTERTAAARTVPTGKATSLSRLGRFAGAYAFLLPALVLVGVFLLWPFLRSAYLSFTEYNGLGTPKWIGLDNYRTLIHDPILTSSIRNTLYWVVGTLLLPVGLGLLIASISFNLKGGAFYRLPFLIPYALSGSAIATLWAFIFVRDGAVNGALKALGLDSWTRAWLIDIHPVWKLDVKYNTLAMIVASTWQAVGVSVLLFLIGLQVIPKDPIEAARLDGAEGWRLFRDVTFPLLRPMTIVTVGISLVNSLKTFDIIWIMTQGGPARSSETLAVTMYRETFLLSRHGYGAAVAVVLSLVVTAVSVAYLSRTLERNVGGEGPARGVTAAIAPVGRALGSAIRLVGTGIELLFGLTFLVLAWPFRFFGSLLPPDGARRTQRVVGNGLRHGILAALAVLWIAPFYIFLVNASASTEGFAKKERWQPPSSFALFDNIRAAWNAAHLGQAIGSSVFYAIVGASLAVVIAALASYALVALRIRHGFFWFMVIYAGTIFPFQMYLSPLYTMFVRWKIYNTHQGLLLFYTAIAIPFATFVIRNHFTSIPHDLSEAARLDGASALTIFRHVFVPLSLNAFATVFILQFTWIWNDLIFGLVLSRSEDIRPIMTALAALQGQYARTGAPVALAGALLVSLPTFVLFFAVQRVFVRGLRATA
ncbi:MAG TPA: ABC transporter permease subunit [Thermomicrobiales bacterium]|jgi:multiple sugar transport system permease protein